MRAYPIVLVALALLAGTAGYISHRALNPPATPVLLTTGSGPAGAELNPAPDDNPLAWRFSTADGGSAAIQDWPAPIVVVNFWASWCPPCLREIPAFIELQQAYGERGLQFVGIALDTAEAVVPFMQEKNINYPVLLGDEQVIRIMQTFGNSIGGLPYTVVLDHGQTAYTHQGEWHKDDAEGYLTGLLEAAARR